MAGVGLGDECGHSFVALLGEMNALRSLNISSNPSLGPLSIKRIMEALKRVAGLSELDLGKLNFGGSEDCFREVAAVLLSCKQLRTLILSRVGLDDSCAFYLIEAISRSTSLQNLRLDSNKLTGVFMERLMRKLGTSGFNLTQLALQSNASSSILHSESEDNLHKMASPARISSDPAEQGSQGFQSLNFECNNMGDRGAEAIAGLICHKNDASRNLKMVNLNECGIGNQGFAKLKEALLVRGNLALEANLSHVGIKVERNLFDK